MVVQDVKAYAEAVCKEISENSECVVAYRETHLDNGDVLHGGVISFEGVDTVVYLDVAYEVGMTPAEGAAHVMREVIYIENPEDFEKMSLDILHNWSLAKSMVRPVVRGIAKEKGEGLLKNQKGDLEFFYRLWFGKQASVLIKKDFLLKWGISFETFEASAWENARKTFKLENIYSRLFRINSQLTEGIPKKKLKAMEDSSNMFVLTNEDAYEGGCYAFDSQIIGECADELWAEKLYIIPSSIHESILVVADEEMDPDKLRKTIGYVNATHVRPEELLTNSLYIYEDGNLYMYDGVDKTLLTA